MTTSVFARTTPVLYEIRIPGVAATTVKAYDADTSVFIPLVPLLEFTGLRYVVDSTHAIAKFQGKAFWLKDQYTFWTQDTAYVAVSNLASALGIDVTIDREDASITFTNTGALPVTRNVARRAARAALDTLRRRGAKGMPDDVHTNNAIEALGVRPSSVPVITPTPSFGSLLIDYTIYRQRVASVASTTLSISAATGLGPGTLITNVMNAGDKTLGDVAWSAVWPATHELKQLRLGYGSSSGLRTIPIRGIYLSNAPLTRPPRFNALALTGSLPPDWSIEAYRDGKLIGFDSVGVGGRYSLPVPIQYGENPFELIAYSPTGEVVQFGRMIRTQSSMLPSGAFEFAASTGACVSRYCSWMMNLDFRYGLSDRWTVRGGATEYSLRSDQTANVYPYVAIDGVVKYGFTMSAEFMRSAYTQFGLSWDPSSRFTFMGDYTKYGRRDIGALFASNMRDQLWLLTRLSLGIPFEAQLTRVSSAIGAHTFLRTGTTLAVSDIALRPYMRFAHSQDSRTTSLGSDAMFSLARFGFSPLQHLGIRGTFETQRMSTLTFAELMLTNSSFWGLSGEIGFRWSEHTRPRLAIMVSSDIGQIRTQTSTLSSLRGDMVSLQQALGGSLRWDADTRQLVRSPDPILERAGISGIVFLDLNGNEQRDPGEPAIKSANIYIDNAVAITNGNGYYEMWGVAPGQIVSVAIDPATLESPWWVPTRQVYRIATAPNRAAPLNIAVVRAGVVEGTIVSDDGVLNVPVILTNTKTGRVYTLDPFSDGTFYQMGILPGTYEIRLDSKVLARLEASARPVKITVEPNQTAHTTIRVERSIPR